MKINEDITLQSQKYSSALVEAYDFIEVIWKHVYDYSVSLRAVLEVMRACYYVCYHSSPSCLILLLAYTHALLFVDDNKELFAKWVNIIV